MSLLNPKVIRDLRLHEHGLRIVERRAQNSCPRRTADICSSAEGRTEREIAKFSARDAERYAAFNREIDVAADVLRELVLQAPPNLRRGIARPRRVAQGRARSASRLRRLSDEDLRALYDLFTNRPATISTAGSRASWSRRCSASMRWSATMRSPYTPGTAYVLLHHAFGEVNGKQRVWGHAIGGMGAISEAMARAAASHGVEIETDAAVREILIEGGRAARRRARGRPRHSRRARSPPMSIPSCSTPRWCRTARSPAEFLRRMRGWRCGSGTFRINVALSELPSFTALPGRTLADHHTAGIIIGPSLAYMDRAYCDARAHGWSREPIVEMVIPSTLDDTLAPTGAHVASLFCQHVAPELPDGRSWDDHRDSVADLMIETVDSLRARIQGQRGRPPGAEPARSGADLRACRRRHLPTARCRSISCSGRGPMLGYADYRGPLPGSITAAPARIPAAASPARPGTTPRARSSPTGAGGRRGVDRPWIITSLVTK